MVSTLGNHTYSAKSNVPEGQCDRSLARSAWDSANPKSRPVGYGMIRAGVRTESSWCTFPREMPMELAAPDQTVPYGTVHSRDTFPGTSCLATIGFVPTGRGPAGGLSFQMSKLHRRPRGAFRFFPEGERLARSPRSSRRVFSR
jgi:hypothetical protein